MYYKLHERIALRGWKLVPYGYYIYGVEQAQGLTAEQFGLLSRCDGAHDLPDSPLLQRFLQAGMIRPCEKGEGLEEWQKPRFYKNRYFPHLNWAITGKCNFNCLHCFMAADNAPMMEEFTWEQCLNLLDECVRCGIQTITLTGGEPMVHPRFMDIVRECAKRHLNIAEINTNGSFITEEMLEEFRALSMDVLIKISYDGIGHHDWLRNMPGAEEKAIRAIRLCKEKGFRVRVQTNVHRGNLEVMFDTVAEMDRLGVEEIRIIRTSETPRWKENGGDQCLGITEYYDEMLRLMERLVQEDFRIRVDIWQFAIFNPITGVYHYQPVQGGCGKYRESTPVCKGARGTIAVAHTGELVPCNQLAGTFAKMGIHCGNVKQTPLSEILAGRDYLDMVTMPVTQVLAHNEDCRACQYWKCCMGGCRAISTAFTGDFLHYDPSKCAFFKGGYMKRIDQVFAKAARAYRCMDDTGDMDKGGERE